jgi:ABC-type phosphate transport system substrate-binding protein
MTTKSRMQPVLLALLVSLLWHGAAVAAGYKVIVNNANGTSTLAKKDLSQLFMKKTAKWSDGTPVVAVDQTEKSTAREKFTQEVHGKSVAAVKSYWQQQIFSGRDVPPVEKSSDAQVVAFVKQNAGAIGYVSESADTSTVKVITVQ